MPVYNSVDFLERTVENLARQTLPDLEVIAINDGSSDGTGRLLDQLAARHNFLRAIHLQQNGGAYIARNVGIEHATGQYLAFIDVDDLITDDRMEKMYRIAITDEIDFLCDNLEIFDHAAQKSVGRLFRSSEDITALTFELFCSLDRPTNHFNIGLVKPIIRRNFITRHGLRFNTKYRSNADFAFFALVLALTPRARLMREALYRYTAPIGPISGRPSPHRRTHAKLSNFISLDRWTIEQICQKAPDRDVSPLLEHQRSLEQHRAILDLFGRRSLSSLAVAGLQIATRPRYLRFCAERLLGHRFRTLSIS